MEKKYIQIYFLNNPNYKYFVDCEYWYSYHEKTGVPTFLHVSKAAPTGEDETHTYPIMHIERVVERPMRSESVSHL